jgi:carboxyl-terminal processing protease
MASEFTKGTIVKEEFSNGSTRSMTSDHAGKLTKVPLVVLVNGGSASASEIVAGAIKDDNRGKIVGEKTFGKGTVQEPIEFDGGAGLHVTVAKWLTPKGSSIHGAGIEPDIKVEISEQDRENEKDPQLERAIKELK